MVQADNSELAPSEQSTDLYRKLRGRKVSMSFEFIEEGGIGRWVGDGHIAGTRVGVFMWMTNLDQFKEQMEAHIQLLLDVQDEERRAKERRSRLQLVPSNGERTSGASDSADSLNQNFGASNKEGGKS